MDGFMTIKEAAKKWDVTIRWVQKLCSAGRIDGVQRFGRAWVIPIGTEKPKDARVTTGEYRNWRTKKR